MENSQRDANQATDVTSRKPPQERRSQVRNNTVLSRIEDMTYEILRKHEKQSA